jgi:triacylglycerol lipase
MEVSMRRTAVLIVAMAAAIGVSVGLNPAGAATYPVPYVFEPLTVSHPNIPPAGTNDWTCKPSERHPEPVVLVHGTFANMADNWTTYGPLLANEGYCVYAFNYGARDPENAIGGLRSIESSAVVLAQFVQRVLAATGARKVDIVGHSQGAVMPDYYAKFLGGGAYVDKYVSLAPVWHGTSLVGLGPLTAIATALGVGKEWTAGLEIACVPCAELLAGSSFMNHLRSGGSPAVPGVTYTNIVTRNDELVTPYTSGIQTGMANIVIQDVFTLDQAEHLSLVYDRRASVAVLNALDPAHPRPLPCVLTLPFIGTV